MKKLPKSQTASSHRLAFEGLYIANLMASGHVNQRVILIGDGEKWQEIDCISLGLPNTDIDDFNRYIKKNKLTLQDLGIYTESKSQSFEVVDLQPKHDDYMRLESEFPDYPYFMISKLYRHISSNGRKSNFNELREFMRRVQESGLTIPKWINKSENDRYMFVEKISPAEPYVSEYSANGVTINITVFKDDTGKYAFNSQQGSEWFSASARNYDSIFEAEWAAIYDALTNLRNEIIKGNNPDKYKELFRIIQNKYKSINMSEKIKERESQLTALKFTYIAGQDLYSGHSMSITGNEIENLSDDEWQAKIDGIEMMLNVNHVEQRAMYDFGNSAENVAKSMMPDPPSTYVSHETTSYDTALSVSQEPETTTATTSRGMSLSAIEGLDAAKVSEFKNLDKETEKLIKANPLIQITDKTTLEKAKKHRQAMLKACTAIDGKDGLQNVTKKAFNTVKSVFDKFLGGIAEKRRAHYNALDTAVTEYEHAEELRQAEETRQRLEKITNRTNQLFAVPMVFNGSMYSIGTMYVLPSQIEGATDEEFAALVAEAQKIKSDLDNQAAADKEKDALIRELQEKLAQLTGGPAAPVQRMPAPEQPAPAVAAPPVQQPAPIQTPPPAAAPHAAPPVSPATYVKPDPENYLLAKFDMEPNNTRAINMNPIPEAFIQARGYYVRGMKDVSQAIIDMLNDESVPNNQKRGMITDLCNVVLNQK